MWLRRRLERRLPWIALLALLAACFGRLVAQPDGLLVDGRRPSIDHADPSGPRTAGNDLTLFFLPHHLSIARALSTCGHVPFWDTRGFGGRPTVGNPQGGMFYPPVWAVWFSGSPAALGWLTVAHLLWGALGVYVLLRSARLGRWAATVGAGIYEASPYLLAHVYEGHYPHVWAACWYPWAFWAFREQRAGRARGFLILSLVLALTYLAGHPQEWFLLVLALSIWQVADAITAWRQSDRRAAARKILIFLAVLAMSMGLAGVETVPQGTIRPWLLRHGEAGQGIFLPRRYHLQALNAFQLLSPSALGGPADYFGDDNYWETVLSIGLAPLVLGLTAALWHPKREFVRGWLVLAGLAIWFACGRHMLFYAVLYVMVPGMSLFRVPARSLFLANLACAVLAGMGLDTLQSGMTRPGAWRTYWCLWAALAGLLLLCLFLVAIEPIAAWHRASLAANRVLRDGCFWLVASGLAVLITLGWLTFQRRKEMLPAKLMGLLALVELGCSGFALLQTAPAARFLGLDPIGQTLVRLGSKSSLGALPRIKARDSFYGDLPATLHGLEKSNINDVFQLDHAAWLYETLYRVASRPRPFVLRLPMGHAVEDYQRQVRQAVLDRMAVAYLVSDRLERDLDWPVAAQGFWNGSPYVIQRNPTALPRAYVVPSMVVAPADPREALSYFRELDPRKTVLLSDRPSGDPASGPRQPFTPVEWICNDPDRPAFRVTTTAPGYLVVADTWMPGWTARVDGQRSAVLRGNLAQRVVPLFRPGRHAIVMEYRPPGFLVGCALTAFSCGSCMVLAGVLLSRSRKRRGSRPALARAHHFHLVHARRLGLRGRGRYESRARLDWTVALGLTCTVVNATRGSFLL